MDEGPKVETKSMPLTKAPDYRTYHATGMFGGISPYGELQLTILEDLHRLPQGFELERVDEATYKELAPKQAGPERVALATFVFPGHRIPSFIRWLESKHQEYLKWLESEGKAGLTGVEEHD